MEVDALQLGHVSSAFWRYSWKGSVL